MGKIELTQGKFALIDPDDLIKIGQYKWYLMNGYAATQINKKKVYMHRLINNTPEGFETDHINGDKLDNRKENLRSVNKQQNGFNRGKNKNNTSGYKGVSFDKSKKKYLAHIKMDGKLYFLGRYETAIKAYLARKEAEICMNIIYG